MKSHILVENIKCNGCATTIIKRAESIPAISGVSVNVEEGKVSFSSVDDNAKAELIAELKKWGYAEAGTGTKLDGAKSYVGCMIGKIDNLKA